MALSTQRRFYYTQEPFFYNGINYIKLQLIMASDAVHTDFTLNNPNTPFILCQPLGINAQMTREFDELHQDELVRRQQQLHQDELLRREQQVRRYSFFTIVCIILHFLLLLRSCNIDLRCMMRAQYS